MITNDISSADIQIKKIQYHYKLCGDLEQIEQGLLIDQIMIKLRKCIILFIDARNLRYQKSSKTK